MRYTKVITRYAKSLLDLALEKDKLEEVKVDMEVISRICRESRDFRLLLASPIVHTDKKRSIINETFAGKIGKVALTFLEILITKRREHLLHGVADQFLLFYKTHKGIQIAELRTAVALDEETRKQLLQKITELTSSEVELQEEVDESLIGGFVLRVGDRQYDASILKQVHSLQREFDSNPYIKDY